MSSIAFGKHEGISLNCTWTTYYPTCWIFPVVTFFLFSFFMQMQFYLTEIWEAWRNKGKEEKNDTITWSSSILHILKHLVLLDLKVLNEVLSMKQYWNFIFFTYFLLLLCVGYIWLTCLAGSPIKTKKVFCWQLGLLGPEKFEKYTWVFIFHT